MKAWVFHETHQPLRLEEVEKKSPGPGEVLVEVRAAGICHSDVSVLEDETWMSFFPYGPQTPGHENAGVIAEVGEGMDHWKVGDRVGIAPMMPDGSNIGCGQWEGGFGPYLRATDYNLVKLPDEVSFPYGAMATDAGLTAYHALVAVGGATEGQKVGIIGLGGLGYFAARIAVLTGCEVYGADVSEGARGLKDEIGLADVAESILDFQDKGLELIVDFAGFGTTTAEGIEALGESGTFVQVGMGRSEATINTYSIILKHLTIRGSQSGTKEDLAELYELMRGGELNPPMNLITFEDIPEAIEKLSKGGVVGRLVAEYPEGDR